MEMESSLNAGVPPVVPFSKLLRARTNRKRTATQMVSNLTVPLALSSPRVYLALLRAYHFIFVAFEEEFEKRRRVFPRLNAIYFRELLRTSAFEQDIAFFTELSSADSKQLVLPSAKKFVSQMRAALAREPVLVISYSYALYIGLLTASPKMIPWIRTSFDINAEGRNTGVAIWDFSSTIAVPVGFRKRFDTALDELKLRDEQREEIYQQVHLALDSSAEIFKEIKASEEFVTTVISAVSRGLVGFVLLCSIIWVWHQSFLWAFFSAFTWK